MAPSPSAAAGGGGWCGRWEGGGERKRGPEKIEVKVTSIRFLKKKNSRESAGTGGVTPGREMGLKNRPLNLC